MGKPTLVLPRYHSVSKEFEPRYLGCYGELYTSEALTGHGVISAPRNEVNTLFTYASRLLILETEELEVMIIPRSKPRTTATRAVDRPVFVCQAHL